MDLTEAQELFTAAGCYLDTATVGLPPRPAVAALRDGIDDWQRGRLSATEYDDHVARSRAAFGQLVGTTQERVAIASQVSVATGLAATALQPGDEVLLAEEDFTSVLFPFLQAEHRGIITRTVPLDRLIEEVRPSTRMVAVSAAQSADGRVLDLDALADVTSGTNTLTYVDITQAASWLPIAADRFSITACGAYKWLACPRGAGFITVRPDVIDQLAPTAPGWYAGEDPWTSIYGPPLRLAGGARRFDTSPVWFCWVASAPTLELLADVGVDVIGGHDVALANRFRAGVGLPPSDSAIVSIETSGADQALRRAGVAFASRAGSVRLSFHLYNTEADVDHALNALM